MQFFLQLAMKFKLHRVTGPLVAGLSVAEFIFVTATPHAPLDSISTSNRAFLLLSGSTSYVDTAASRLGHFHNFCPGLA